MADGRKRVYQVEIGAVLWTFPAALEPVRADLAKSGCISCLGARGPWVAERLIGMHEFPGEMNLEGKASMVEDAVRSATLGTDGEVDTELHQHILRGTGVWTSDGADLDVGHALAEDGRFSSLVCHAWDESHSAGRLLASALKHDKEVLEVDRLRSSSAHLMSSARNSGTRRWLHQLLLCDGHPSASRAGPGPMPARPAAGMPSGLLSQQRPMGRMQSAVRWRCIC